MTAEQDEFEAVRREPDPIKRGRLATDLLAVYQQRSAELARLRRVAIDEARDRLGGSYVDVARAFGLTKGRITQIRHSAPPPERVFFGVGPVTVAVPGRIVAGRQDLVIASEDDLTAELLLDELGRLAFATERHRIDPREEWEPAGDAVVVCGPASAHVGRALLAADPVLGMEHDAADGRWRIVNRATGERFGSPMDDDEPIRGDVAYLARHQRDSRVVVHIAGVHALGSVGAAHHLVSAVPALYRDLGETSYSLVVSAAFEKQKPTRIDMLIQPQPW